MFRTTWNRVGVVVCLHGWHGVPKRGRCVSVLAVLLSLVALPAAAQTAISADGEVESKSGGFKFPDGTVQTTTAADTDPLHLVGELGEPPFGDGGAGDCLWQNPPPELGGVADAVNPVSFSKDSDGIVRLAGLPVALDGPGGDMMCDSTSNDASDLRIFQLPAGYQPEHLEIFTSATLFLNYVFPVGGLIVEEEFIPGGTVFVSGIADGNTTNLDGITFRAAPPTASLSPAPATVSLQELYELLGRR